MIAAICYVYHYTPDEVRGMTLADLDALMAYARKVADGSRG